MPFDIPDNDVATHQDQARWMSTDIDILAVGLNGVGVVDGCAVTAQGSPDMTVAIAAGNVRIASGATVAVASGNGTITTANATNPRIDLVSVSEAGTKTVTAGTAAASPKPPDLPSGNVGLAMVYVPANDTTISTGQITDKRVVLSARSNVTAFIGAKAYHSTTQGSLAAATVNALNLDSEEYDTDGFHSTSSNTPRMTIPAGLGGKYLVIGKAKVDQTHDIYIRKNGSGGTILRGGNKQSSGESHEVTVMADLVAGDYVEVCEYHGTGTGTAGDASNDHLRTELSLVKLDSGKVGSGIGASLRFSSSQATTTDPFIILWDTEDSDTDGFHSLSSNTGRITIPTGLGGKYVITAWVEHDPTGGRLNLVKNGSTLLSYRTFTDYIAGVAVVLDLVAGDYIEAKTTATTTGNVINTDITSTFAIARLDSGSNSRTTMPGYELDYVEQTGSTSITATTGATANTIVTGSAVVYDGVTVVLVEFFAPGVYTAADDRIVAFVLYDGSTELGRLGDVRANAEEPTDFRATIHASRRLTPSAASHTYSVRAFTNVGSSVTVDGGSGASGNLMPAFIRITRV